MDRIFECQSFQYLGLKRKKLRIEALKTKGVAHLSISGLPDAAIKESKEKIQTLCSKIIKWKPFDRILLQIQPSEDIKSGQHLELPLALATLGVLSERALPHSSQKLIERLSFAGALSLNGSIGDTRLTSAIHQSEREDFIGAHSIGELSLLWEALENGDLYRLENQRRLKSAPGGSSRKATEVEGRYFERMLITAAAMARLPFALIGPPGIGKSHLASWGASVLPSSSTKKKRCEQSLIWLLNGENSPKAPVIRPHAKSHLSEFLGSQRGSIEAPGYFALSHGGTLILDEYCECNKDVREILRNVLDQKLIKKNSRKGCCEWPSDFWLILTSNPCPCGYAMLDDLSRCRCDDSSRRRYFQRLSGPILDRLAFLLFMNPKDSFTPFKTEEKLLSDATEVRESIQNYWEKKVTLEKELEQCRSLAESEQEHPWSSREIQNKAKLLHALKKLTPERCDEQQQVIIQLLRSQERRTLS